MSSVADCCTPGLLRVPDGQGETHRLQEAAFQLYRPVLAGIAPPPRPPAANGIASKEEGAGKEEGEEEGEIAEPAAADNGASLLASGSGGPF